MVCSNCGSSNTRVELINTNMKHKNVSILRTLIRIFLIFMTCGLWLLVPAGRGTSKVKNQKIMICNDCGATIKIKK